MTPDIEPAVAELREHAGPIVVALTKQYGDFALAEDAVQDALVEAVHQWPSRGIPQRPQAWLWVAARANALDAIRSAARRRSREDHHAASATTPTATRQAAATDDRLGLLFACCHPALPHEARLALTLRAVCGLTTAQIARGLLQNEATVAQRIVRAKRRIVDQRIELAIPERDELASRLDDVLTAIAMMFNEAFVSTSGTSQNRDLAADALWLADTVAVALPKQAEAWGLAALLSYHHARAAARFAEGELVILARQNRTLWDQDLIAQAERKLERAAALKRPGRYQLQAAIAACHLSAASWAETDWLQIVILYDMLTRYDASPVVVLNRAVARAHVGGPRSVLAELDSLAEHLNGYHLYHAVHAEILRMAGYDSQAEAANQRALNLTANASEQRLLRTRLRRGALEDGS